MKKISIVSCLLVLGLSLFARGNSCSFGKGTAGITERGNYIITLDSRRCLPAQLKNTRKQIMYVFRGQREAVFTPLFNNMILAAANVCFNSVIELEHRVQQGQIRCVLAIEEEGTKQIRPRVGLGN